MVWQKHCRDIMRSEEPMRKKICVATAFLLLTIHSLLFLSGCQKKEAKVDTVRLVNVLVQPAEKRFSAAAIVKRSSSKRCRSTAAHPS